MKDALVSARKEYTWITLTVFLAGYFLNVVWESLHWVWFYIPDLPVPSFTYITHVASVGDGVWIIILYWLTAVQAKNPTWIQRPTKTNLYTFAGLGITAAAGIEAWAHITNAWSYGSAMPEILGIGVSPLIQLTTTGLISVYIAKTALYTPILTRYQSETPKDDLNR